MSTDFCGTTGVCRSRLPWAACQPSQTTGSILGGDVTIQQIIPEVATWWDQGACRGLDASIFYPDDDVEAQSAQVVCAECAVRSSCLDHALSFREKVGVWGGATEKDRRRIIRQRRRSG